MEISIKEINVRVITNAKEDSISEEGRIIKARLSAPARDGKANRALLDLLSKYFSVKKSSITIVKGEKSRDKIVKIDD